MSGQRKHEADDIIKSGKVVFTLKSRLKDRLKSLRLSPLCCFQVTALSTSGFMYPWAGGRTDVTVTMDTDTGRGPRRGTLRLTMDENRPRTVGV